MRLDRYLANMGIGSRLEVRTLIKQKKITVDGQVVSKIGFQVPKAGLVQVEGTAVTYEPYGYYLLNKPADYLTATIDQKQKTVMALLPTSLPHYDELAPVGRLDQDTTGLLLITNDGQLAHRLIQPQFHVQKTYQAIVNGQVDSSLVAIFAKGVNLSDFTTRPAQLLIKHYDETKKQSLVELTIVEGKYHQVKRMFKAFDHQVLELKRLTFGPFVLDEDLPVGTYRELTTAEVTTLLKISETAH